METPRAGERERKRGGGGVGGRERGALRRSLARAFRTPSDRIPSLLPRLLRLAQGIEKQVVSKMLVPNSNRQSFAVDRHAGIAIAGLAADGRAVVSRASSEAQQYKQFYGHAVPGRVLADRIASFVHVFNLYWYVRPMGVAALVASAGSGASDAAEGAKGAADPTSTVDPALFLEPPALHVIDPSGACHRARGAAVGKGRAVARNEIEKLDLDSLAPTDAVKALAKILNRAHDEEKPFELEMAWICAESGWEFKRVPQALVDQADEEAKAALEEEDMDD